MTIIGGAVVPTCILASASTNRPPLVGAALFFILLTKRI
jgi:hypothetical protein